MSLEIKNKTRANAHRIIVRYTRYYPFCNNCIIYNNFNGLTQSIIDMPAFNDDYAYGVRVCIDEI